MVGVPATAVGIAAIAVVVTLVAVPMFTPPVARVGSGTIGGMIGGGTNPMGGHQATPLVNDGFMYVVDAWGAVYKIDVRDGKSGKMVWIMDPGVDKADVWIASNRGLALYKNFVISVTADGKVLWTNADTGATMSNSTPQPAWTASKPSSSSASPTAQ